MKYKLVAVDLDDSLLGYDHKISEENKKAIRKAVDKGVIFTIATGRPLQSCLPFVKELDLDVPFITYNGALIIKGKSMEVLYHKTMEPQDALDILKEAGEFDPTILIFHDNKLYVNELNDRTQRYSKLSTMTPHLEKDLNIIAKRGPIKVLLYHEPEQINRIYFEIRDKLEGKVNFHTSKPCFLEFIHKDVSKGNGLAALAKDMKISKEEVIAIGDSYNDISMIKYAGMGVAMGNAYDDVKKNADYICKSNIENGVAEVLENFVLEG